MKNFPTALLTFLQANNAYDRADLFAILPGAPQNQFAWSQAFDNAAWTKTRASVTTNVAIAPDGTLTGEKLIEDTTASNSHVALQNSTFPAGSTVTVSVYAKAVERSAVCLEAYGNAPFTADAFKCRFDLAGGTVGSSNVIGAGVFIKASIQSAGNGWYRCSMTGTINPSNTGITSSIDVSSGTAVNAEIYTGTGTSGIFIWGAQLEMSTTLGPYSATAATPLYGSLGPRPAAIFATTSQVDITFQGNVYYSSLFGAWERGKITSEVSFDLKANDMPLTVKVPGTVAYPNTSVTMMGAAQLGLFDAARVQVFTAYWPPGQLPNPSVASLGVETKYVGFIKPNGKISRSLLEFEVADGMYLLNLKLPRNLIQASCRHTLYDANCTMSPFNFDSPLMTVNTGSTRQNLLTTASLGQSPPYFTQGFVSFVTGQNAGYMFSIKQQVSTTNILLAAKMPLPLAIGDKFVAYAGCDKSEATCVAKFNNLIHIGATPFVPNPEVAI